MFSNNCAAHSCKNTQQNKPELAFFSFPKSIQFARAWVVACNNPDLMNKSLGEINQHYLCAEHFEDKCFTNPKNKTHLIRWNDVYPIPTLFKYNNPPQEGVVSTTPLLTTILKQCNSSRLEKICRFCSSLKPTSSLMPIYGSFYEPILKKLRPFGIFLGVNDGLPTQICRTCAAKLLICVETLDQFKDSEKKLKVFESSDISTLSGNEEVLERIVENDFYNDGRFVVTSIPPQEDSIQQKPEEENNHQIEEMEINETVDEIKVEIEGSNKGENIHKGTNPQLIFVNVKQEKKYTEILPTNNSCTGDSTTHKVEFIEMNNYKPPIPIALENNDPLNDECPVNCVKCGLFFKDQKILMIHNREKHMTDNSSEKLTKTKAIIYQCKACNAILNSSIAYLTHLKMHAAKTPGIELSKLRTEIVSNVQKKDLTKNSKKYKCDLCELSFLRKNQLRLHVANHKKIPSQSYINKPFRLEIGDTIERNLSVKRLNSEKITDFDTDSQNDILIIDEEKDEVPVIDIDEDSNPSDKIKKNETWKLNVGERIKENVENTGRWCNICKEEFNINSMLLPHIKTAHMMEHLIEDNLDKVHDIVEKPVKCNVCHLPFKTLYTLKCHFDKHLGVKNPFACDKCEMRFRTCSEFVTHYEKHKPKIDYDRPYACEICKTRFFLATALKRHKKREHSINS